MKVFGFYFSTALLSHPSRFVDRVALFVFWATACSILRICTKCKINKTLVISENRSEVVVLDKDIDIAVPTKGHFTGYFPKRLTFITPQKKCKCLYIFRFGVKPLFFFVKYTVIYSSVYLQSVHCNCT